jgi:hypothetical protein
MRRDPLGYPGIADRDDLAFLVERVTAPNARVNTSSSITITVTHGAPGCQARGRDQRQRWSVCSKHTVDSVAFSPDGHTLAWLKSSTKIVRATCAG